jgi:hypothetical protein
MGERERFEAGKEARRTVIHDAGHEQTSTDHMEALVRYLKGAGQGQSTGTGRARPLTDAEIRTRAVDLVTAIDGEVTAAMVAAGSVLLRGRCGQRSQIRPLEKALSTIPGVTRLDLRMHYDVDDL